MPAGPEWRWTTWCSTSCTSARSRRRAPSMRSSRGSASWPRWGSRRSSSCRWRSSPGAGTGATTASSRTRRSPPTAAPTGSSGWWTPPTRRASAVYLDVVYNHLGPEGNVLHGYGPYFTDRYRTPWGDGGQRGRPGSDGVRDYLIERCAVGSTRSSTSTGCGWTPSHQHRRHQSARPFLAELHDRAQAQSRSPGPHVAAHRRERSELPAHHHRARRRRPRDGRPVGRRLPPLVARASHRRGLWLLRRLRHRRPTWPMPTAKGFVYRGRRSRYRGRRHGASPAGLPASGS